MENNSLFVPTLDKISRFTTKNRVERAKKGREWTYQATRIPNYHKESH